MVNSAETQLAMETVLQSMRNVGSQLSALKSKVRFYNNALDNLRHIREFNETMTCLEILDHDKEVHRISKERRVIKDEIMVLGAFKGLYDDNPGLRDAMQNVVNSMECAKRRVGSQRYFLKDTGGVV